ncbi:MAG: hypothetical protein HOV80_21760 [Polyangiaceae bacterium]|nr:hypothetical protein [Polyangiaceae bacterium]
MTGARRVWVAFLLITTGCSEATKPSPTGSSTAAQGSGAPSASTSPTTPAVPKPAPETVTHYASATPPPSNAKCAALPAAKNESSTVAAAVRRLSCEPALYYLSTKKLREELALPADVKLEPVGVSAFTLEFPKRPAKELAAAMGVEKPVATRSTTGAWGFRIWRLATEGKDGPEIWGPGRVTMRVGVETGNIEDSVDSVPLGDAATNDITVSMPEDVLPTIDDEAAVATLRAALAYIAENPGVLSKEPEEVAKLAGLEGDRFRVSRRSIGTGPDAIKGIDIWTKRTQVGAGDVIAALDAKGRIEHNKAHDSDDYLLYSGSKESFSHRSLDVTLSFDERSGKEAAGPHGKYVLNGVFLMPAGKK